MTSTRFARAKISSKRFQTEVKTGLTYSSSLCSALGIRKGSICPWDPASAHLGSSLRRATRHGSRAPFRLSDTRVCLRRWQAP